MYYKTDESGNYLGIKSETNEGWEFFSTTPVPTDIARVRNENGTWVSAISNEELIIEYTKRIQNAFTYLRRRALASSINKQGEWEYIYEQAEQYKLKYKVAKGEIVNTSVEAMIADEANDFGITSENMNVLIIQMYEAGELAYNQFTAMIERGRTKALTMLETANFDKALQIILIMETVPEKLTMEQAEVLTIQMISI
jgi:hypothetical protein